MAAKYGAVVVTEDPIDSEDVSLERHASREDAPLLMSSLVLEDRQHNAPFPVSRRLAIRVMTIISLALILVQAGATMLLPPMIAIIREKLCAERTVMFTGDEPQNSCGHDAEVERQLAYILGLLDFLSCLPMILLSSIFGSLADRYGRRFILFLSVLGLLGQLAWQAFAVLEAPKISVRLIWLAPIFTVVGGGPSVAVAIIFTICGDVVPSEHKASAFSYVQAVSVAGSMLGSFLASVMMLRVGNTIPLLVGLGLAVSMVPLIALLPDTQRIALSQSQPSAAGLSIEDDHSVESHKLRETASGTFLQSLQNLVKTPGSLSVLIASFLSLVGQPIAFLIFQYFPYSFGLSVAQANFFMVWQYGLNLFALLVLVPLMNAWMLRRGYSVFRKDISLAHLFCYMFLAGSVLMSFAPSLAVAAIGLIIYSFGTGLGAALRSVYLELLPVEEAAFATTIISLVKSLGGTLAGPLCDAVYTVSLGWGNSMSALPLYVVTLCFVVSVLVLTQVRKPHQRVV